MTVAELIAVLQTMNPNFPVEINDNNGGEIYNIAAVDQYDMDCIIDPDENDYPVVMIQINCD